MYGLSDSDYKLVKMLVFEVFRKKNARLFVFGSRARGKWHPFSDLDLIYEENPKEPFSLLELTNLKEAIEDSDLTINIDLVKKEELAESYRSSVEKEMIEIPLKE